MRADGHDAAPDLMAHARPRGARHRRRRGPAGRRQPRAGAAGSARPARRAAARPARAGRRGPDGRAADGLSPRLSARAAHQRGRPHRRGRPRRAPALDRPTRTRRRPSPAGSTRSTTNGAPSRPASPRRRVRRPRPASPSGDALVWAAGEGWHPGVVGIVASRLKEALNLPRGGDRPARGRHRSGIGALGQPGSISARDPAARRRRTPAQGRRTPDGGGPDGVERDRDRGGDGAPVGDLLGAAGGGRPAVHAISRIDATLMPRAATSRSGRHAGARRAPSARAPPPPVSPSPICACVHARAVGDGHLKLTLADGGPTPPRRDRLSRSTAAASPLPSTGPPVARSTLPGGWR